MALTARILLLAVQAVMPPITLLTARLHEDLNFVFIYFMNYDSLTHVNSCLQNNKYMKSNHTSNYSCLLSLFYRYDHLLIIINNKIN